MSDHVAVLFFFLGFEVGGMDQAFKPKRPPQSVQPYPSEPLIKSPHRCALHVCMELFTKVSGPFDGLLKKHGVYEVIWRHAHVVSNSPKL